ncbi:hypothetical protein [Streptococcus sanguinis]|uniref:hypothetical protein n=1 Tax=Streptococcus sanguinis TaxID=1305 RepID=UPI000F67D4D0|nr:hypothetical protein [Streptococcus sanguinis]RSI33873.1 hypothetical protein D8876_10180 [Streptococcus sanguinis]
MGIDTKRISPDHIKGVEASFKVADSHLAEKSSDLIESDATEKLSAATSSVKQIITDMSDTVENLDKYLNSIADAFAKVDGDLAKEIKNNITESFSNGKSTKQMQAEEKERQNKAKQKSNTKSKKKVQYP